MVREWLVVMAIGVGGAMCMAQETGPASAPATGAATQATDGFLSEDQLAALFRDGKYADVLHETGRIRNAPGVLARYDAFNLQLLRAECYLQLRNGRMAAETFGQAALLTRDTGKQALMRATAMVIQRSVGLKYVCRNTDDEGNPTLPSPPLPPGLHTNERHAAATIDLLVLGKRTAALKALYTDQWFVTRVAVEQAKHATAMSGYDRALKSLDDLAITEEAIVGKEEATQKLRDQTAGEMDATIRSALAEMSGRVEKVQASAVEQIVVHVPTSYMGNDGLEHQTTVERQRARGLTEADVRMLEGIRETSSMVESSTRYYARRLHAEAPAFAKSVADAGALTKLVKEVLTRNTVYRDSSFVR